MDFNIAINQTLILFLIITMGYIAGKNGVLTEDGQKSLSTVLLNIGLPCLALSSANMAYSSEVMPNIIKIGSITIISYIVIIGLSMLLAKALKLKDGTYNAFISLIVFGNVGFMGYPIAFAFFKEIGVFYASIVNLIFTLLVWTYGLLLYDRQGKIDMKKLFNIGSIASVVTIFLFLFQIRLPYVIQTALDLTGKMTVSLSCILIGAMIAGVHGNKIFKDSRVFIVAFVKLLVIPIATAFILKFLNMNDMVISICVLMAAMPSGATNAIFAKQYNSEPEFASIGVFITTLLSIVTLPAIVYMLTNFIFVG
jgi:Predicted permeases